MDTDDELIKFSEYISANYKKLSLGDYFSDNKKYHIRLISDKKLLTPARVNHPSGRMELNKFQISKKKQTNNFVFLLILWCRERNYSNRTDGDVDIQSIKIYLKLKKPPKDAVIGWLKTFKETLANSYNLERYEAINQYIVKNHNPNEQHRRPN